MARKAKRDKHRPGSGKPGTARLSNNQKRKIGEYAGLAMNALASGRHDLCEAVCRELDGVQPGNADAAFFRGLMMLEASGHEAAIPYMRQAVEAAPKRIDFLLNLANLYLQATHYAAALDYYRRAEELDDRSPLALLGCCQALAGLSRHEEARSYLARARGSHIRQAHEYMQLGVALRELGEMDQAMDVLGDTLKRFPDFVDAAYTRALTAMQAGDTVTFDAALEQTLALDPNHARALKLMADAGRYAGGDEALAGRIHAALEASQGVPDDRVYLLNAMGRVKHRLADHAGSFACYREANELRLFDRGYDAPAALAEMDRIMQAFTPEVLAGATGVEDAAPIFVVGLPRCGSTLIEQILVAHSEVSGRGEIDALALVLGEAYAEGSDLDIAALPSLTGGAWAGVAEEYLDRLRQTGPDTRFIVDKSLNNFLYLGAIACALPRARIVHVRRHPLDVCLSIFTSNLQGHLYDYGLRLETLGRYFLQYREMMRHWRRVLPAGLMIEIDYEQLVADQAGETRKLLDACGLIWEDACLDFQKARERVTTASIMQVRKPMYDSSVARWKRYETELQPLIDIFGSDAPSLD